VHHVQLELLFLERRLCLHCVRVRQIFDDGLIVLQQLVQEAEATAARRCGRTEELGVPMLWRSTKLPLSLPLQMPGIPRADCSAPAAPRIKLRPSVAIHYNALPEEQMN